jgi:hypothetical protein
MPFHAYDWINYINQQKWLFLPENYKLEDDPIFRDPILIWGNGSVSNDTVEERIAKYYRYYNIVGLVYTPNAPNLYEYTSFLFKNISDTFFLLFETNHLSSFTSMIIPNIMNFVVDGRFFYLPRFMVLFYYRNHIDNPAFYIILSLLLIFIIICVIFDYKDEAYFDNLDILDQLKKEIIKTKFDYDQIDPGLNDENIFRIIPGVNPELNKKKRKDIADMFDEYNVDGIPEVEEDKKDNKNEDDDASERNESNVRNTNAFLKSSRNNDDDDNEEDEDEQREKETRINIKKKNKNKDNPPKKRNNDNDEDLNDAIRYNGKKQVNNSIGLDGINSVNSRTKKLKLKNGAKRDRGYGDEDLDDFTEKKLVEKMSAEKGKNNFRGTKQYFDLNTLNSKSGLNQTKFSRFSKYSNLSTQSKKKYFIDKDNTKANYISIDKFHNKEKYSIKDKEMLDKEKERKILLEEYTRLNITPYAFFKYNLRTRHILVAPFLNLTLFHNRWKKLFVLLTQFYIQWESFIGL